MVRKIWDKLPNEYSNLMAKIRQSHLLLPLAKIVYIDFNLTPTFPVSHN